MSNSPSVIVAGGGTAGHISPMLAIADAVRSLDPGAAVTAVGTSAGMEARLVPEAGYALEFIDRVPLPRKPSPDLLKLPTRFHRAVKQARDILRRHDADVVVGVGGYVCTPVYIAAAQEKVPVVIHEANRRPGIANRVGARRAAVVATAFAETPIRGARHVGMPMRPEIAATDRARDRAGARQLLGLQEDVPTVIVTGGSLGAQNMNRCIERLVTSAEWKNAKVQMLHITGRGKELLDGQGNPLVAQGYHQAAFINGMENVYAAADVLVARSGAATVSEVAAVGCPAVFVPLPIGNGEQSLNAHDLVDAGAALMVDDAEFTPEWFVRNVLPVVADADRLDRMSRTAYGHGIRDAAEVMAALTLEAAAGKEQIR